MKLKFFKKSTKQSSTAFQVENQVEVFHACTYSDLRRNIGRQINFTMYKAASVLSTYEAGEFFAAIVEVNGKKSYVFAHISNDNFNRANVIAKFDNRSYSTRTVKTTHRSDKNWIYEADTDYCVDVEVEEKTKNKKLNTKSIATSSVEELLANFTMEEIAAKLIQQAKELEKAQDEVVQLETKVVEAERKCKKHYANKVSTARWCDNTIQMLINAFERGESPEKIIKTSNSLRNASKFAGMDTLQSEAELNDMLENSF